MKFMKLTKHEWPFHMKFMKRCMLVSYEISCVVISYEIYETGQSLFHKF